MAANGNPGAGWLQYNASLDNQQHIFLREPGLVRVSVEEQRRKRFCDFWEGSWEV